MLTWAFACVLFAALLAAAAFGASAAASATRHQSRMVWALAITISVAWPAVAQLLPREPVPSLSATSAVAPALGAAHALTAKMSPISAAVASGVALGFVCAWAAASLMLLHRLFRAQRLLGRMTSKASAVSLDGQRVLVSDEIGPAAVGVLRPRIAVPSWIADLDGSLRAMILRHELAHCTARDTLLLWLSELCIAAMPWNPAVWWQARRLRLAIEMDCDLRTLRNASDQTMYAQLLVLIAQRQSLHPSAPMIAAFDSHLQQRISAMRRPIASIRSPRVVLSAALAITAAIAACTPAFRNDVAGISASAQRDNRIYSEKEVATAVAVLPTAKAPQYPTELRASGLEGQLLAAFVVDTAGLVELTSFKASNSTDARFTDAVQAALPGFRFSPALLANGRKVRQQVVQPFMFALDAKK